MQLSHNTNTNIEKYKYKYVTKQIGNLSDAKKAWKLTVWTLLAARRMHNSCILCKQLQIRQPLRSLRSYSPCNSWTFLSEILFLFHNHLEVIISELSAVCQAWDKVQVWPVLYSSFESWRLSILEKYKTPLMSDFIIWFDWYTTTIFDQLLKDIEFLLLFFIKGSRAGRVSTVQAIQKFPSNDCLGICSCFRNFRI